MNEITDYLDCIEEDDKIFDPNWFKDTLYKIKQKLVNSSNPNELKKSFEDYDESNQGSLDLANFKTCLMRSQLRLSVKDINRIVRYLDKDLHNCINYYDFLQQVERVDITATAQDKVSDLHELAEKLTSYLRQNNLTILQLLKNIKSFSRSSQEGMGENQKVSNELVSNYLHQKLFQSTNKNELDLFVEDLDLDCDGFIEEHDIISFLQNYKYFDQIFVAPKIQTRDYTVQKQLQAGTKSLGTKALFPFQKLSEKKINQVLKDLRYKLELKLMNYEALFKFLDADSDGFITIKEFSEQIDKILPLSQPIKDGFFAFMDRLHIGMVDLSNFLKAMNKSSVSKEQPITEDNFNWEMDIIVRIRDWFAQQRFTVEDAFRTLDKNFQGQIFEKDIRTFLIEQIKLKEEDITDGKINRLFKLMDQYKRGRITCEDFRRFLCEDFVVGRNQTIMGDQIIDNFSSFDWKLNAKQQLGLVLTRRFPDLTKSFDVISGYRKKLLYDRFLKWVTDTNAMKGFDLTEKLMQDLFSDLDQHKKGYLTEQDWEIAFGGYNWKKQMKQEVSLMIKQNFASLGKAFEFFQQDLSKQHIDYPNFCKAINSLFPKRFIDSDISDLWKIYAGDQPTISKKQFIQLFGDEKDLNYAESFVDLKMRPLTAGPLSLAGQSLKDLTIRTYTTKVAPFKTESLLDRIRRFMRAANINPAEILEEADISKTGFLTNLQFRNALQKMKFGLNKDEVDLLINICGQEGLLNWKQFVKMIDYRESDKCIMERSRIKLKHIADLVYSFLISPKDAFRMFDTAARGMLDFDQFHYFIQQICYMDNEAEVPPYAIIKDLFEYFDKGKDGFIDMKEWMDVFAQYDMIVRHGSARQHPLHLNQQKMMLDSIKQKRPMSSQPEEPNILKSNSLKVLPQYQKLFGRPKTAQFNAVNQQPYLRFAQNQEKELYSKLGQWEASKEYDKVILAIGRNRKYLLDHFQSLSSRHTPITYDVAKNVIEFMLRNSGLSVKEEGWPVLIKFAEKDGIIDYKLLLDIYKERIKKIDSHPKNLESHFSTIHL